MQQLSKGIIAGVTTMVLSSAAMAEFSANIGVTSNYLWRGVSQTKDGPAVQGGVDWTHASGLYAGTWLSNVDFSEEQSVAVVDPETGEPTGDIISVEAGSDGSGGVNEFELDLYAGYRGQVGDFGYDLGLLYYAYPKKDHDDFTELRVSGSWKWVTVGLDWTVQSEIEKTPEGYGNFIKDDLHYYANVDFELPMNCELGLGIGYYDFTKPGPTEAGLQQDYTHLGAKVSRTAGDFGTFSFGLDYADEKANGDSKARPVVSWIKQF